ncbi:MAG: ABC transporter permease [Alphaproteobacteria bacterium CG_4_10_14_0_2_um_filter_63_37]|nr:MAG: hypothetical protein AUJ55_05210 [Proteobacteria bacterium CG1_02_64_396]PJA25096.1 MAG: ABC transporter permease [Alphaproteobacteria bacterium CG_4_10_14_0_2_um_filter_63_37]
MKGSMLLFMAVTELARRPLRHLAVLLAATFVVFWAGSILLTTDALIAEGDRVVATAPDLRVERIIAGRHADLTSAEVAALGKYRGVRRVQGRVWGYYFDAPTGVNLTLMGILPGAQPPEGVLEGRMPQRVGEAVLGAGVAQARFLNVGRSFSLLRPDGELEMLTVVGILKAGSQMLSSDLILAPPETVRAVFQWSGDRFTDAALTIAHPEREGAVLARKIVDDHPAYRVVGRSDLSRTLVASYRTRSGLMLATAIGLLAAFALLAWDRMSAVTGRERARIGLLKAVGWSTRQVVALELLQAAAVGVGGFVLGLALAWVHVFALHGAWVMPLLGGWSVLLPPFDLPPAMPWDVVLPVAALTLLPYLAASVVPAWRAASHDPIAGLNR